MIHRKGTIRIGRIFIFPKVTTWLAITFSATCNEAASDFESIFDESAFWDLNPLWIHVTAWYRLRKLVQIRCFKIVEIWSRFRDYPLTIVRLTIRESLSLTIVHFKLPLQSSMCSSNSISSQNISAKIVSEVCFLTSNSSNFSSFWIAFWSLVMSDSRVSLSRFSWSTPSAQFGTSGSLTDKGTEIGLYEFTDILKHENVQNRSIGCWINLKSRFRPFLVGTKW